MSGTFYPTGIWEFVDELLDDREGTSWSSDFHREYTRRFLVMVRDKTMSSIIAAQCPGLPLPYSFYQSGNGVEFDELSLCTKLHAKQDGQDYCRWVVTAQYSTVMPAGGPAGHAGQPNKQDGAGNNPEQEPPELEWDFETAHKAKPCDLDGKAFLNSSNQPFSPAPTFDEAYPVLVMSRNELGFNRSKAARFAYALNDAPFLGAPKLHAQCMPPKARAMFKGNTAYWRVHYRIRFKLEAEGPTDADAVRGWQPRLLDQGTKIFQLQADGTKKAVPIMDGLSVAHHPVLLDGHGNLAKTKLDMAAGPVAVAALIADGDAETPIAAYRDYNVYRTRSFKDLLTKGLS